MATTVKQSNVPAGSFWTLVGMGLLVVFLAIGWRVANGADLEAKWKEWTVKVGETARALEEAKKQLEAEAKTSKENADRREAYWTSEVAAARASCGKQAANSSTPPVEIVPSTAGSEKALADVAKSTMEARVIAEDLARLKAPSSLFRF